MLVCKCGREMKCIKTGSKVYLEYNDKHVYASDTFECPNCGIMVAHANDQGHFDPKFEPKEYDIMYKLP